MPTSTLKTISYLCCIFCLTSCNGSVEIGYQPPAVPIRVSINTDGEINVELSGQFVTPIGVFDIGAGATVYSFLDRYENQVLLVRVDNKGVVYKLEGGKEFNVNFDNSNIVYKKVALNYQSNGDIVLELVSVKTDISSAPEEVWSNILSIRKPTLNEIRAEIPVSLWDINLLDIRDMTSPGIDSYLGEANSQEEYLIPVYWCATSVDQLAQNNEYIQTIFKVNEEKVPEKLVFNYDYDTPNGWNCSYHAIIVSRWIQGEQYKIQAIRMILADISDGQTNYSAGDYIFELVVNAK